MTAERLRKSSRLTRAGELRALLRQGKSQRTGHLDLFTRPSPVGSSRLAVLVPRFTFTAVRRNALRRRLREICRREVLPLLPEPTDVTVRARASAYSARFATLRTELLGSLCRCSPDSAS